MRRPVVGMRSSPASGLVLEKAIAVQRQLRRPCGLCQEQLVARRVVSGGQPREALAPKSIVFEPEAHFIFREIRSRPALVFNGSGQGSAVVLWKTDMQPAPYPAAAT